MHACVRAREEESFTTTCDLGIDCRSISIMACSLGSRNNRRDDDKGAWARSHYVCLPPDQNFFWPEYESSCISRASCHKDVLVFLLFYHRKKSWGVRAERSREVLRSADLLGSCSSGMARSKILTCMPKTIPPGHYFDFYIVCTIYLNGTNCMRMSLNFVPLVVHCILNMLFPLVKLFVANGDEHPHYSWKKRNTTQQYCSLLVPPGAASNCRKGVSILYLFNTIWRKIQVYLVRILGPFHWQ